MPLSADDDPVLTRLTDARHESPLRDINNIRLLQQSLAPAPCTTPAAELNRRVGAKNRVVTTAPGGRDIAHPAPLIRDHHEPHAGVRRRRGLNVGRQVVRDSDDRLCR